jgi:C-3',4' desaturase CrtD
MFRTDVQSELNGRRGTVNGRRGLPSACDVAVLGGGMSGMATAARLQAAGLSTVVLEAHGHVGGCAGYWRHRGYSFDVGATTLVDFEPGGVGAELLTSIGMPAMPGEALPGYQVWLPDRLVSLYRDQASWHRERLRAFGRTDAHGAFWALLDQLADAFWAASRTGVRLPMRRPADVAVNLGAVGLRRLALARYLRMTLGEALRRYDLRDDVPLVTLLGMLVQDTVHSSVDRAPLINAALGVTIRGAGLTRHRGGMHGFWRRFVSHYRALGGDLQVSCRVHAIEPYGHEFRVRTRRGTVHAGHVVCALPAQTAAQLIGSMPVRQRLQRYLSRDEGDLGGAVVVFLGVPDEDVDQPLTHHQLLHDYGQPLGDGNNMFVSVSAPGDTDSAPAGRRAVMISTHTELSAWEGLSEPEYRWRKQHLGERLVDLARRVYPRLGEHASVCQVGTPRSYERFAFRPRGAVGGVRQTLHNSNQHAIPHDLGLKGLWLVGDSTWPGLGTVACVVGSRIVAAGVLHAARPRTFRSSR